MRPDTGELAVAGPAAAVIWAHECGAPLECVGGGGVVVMALSVPVVVVRAWPLSEFGFGQGYGGGRACCWFEMSMAARTASMTVGLSMVPWKRMAPPQRRQVMTSSAKTRAINCCQLR